ncbi:hypothetical protein H109_03873 [Trichophyton interdigitale MR816]|uniref:Deacetylase complex subunit Sds3 n=1 Tax=Trichophyton interdigitale (strain MR816) TaxID=1215338 RepID=A0A059J9B4_TRIIM|nr:hypothetical protein H109_03873 [Trichophyton interdigitale MR816]
MAYPAAAPASPSAAAGPSTARYTDTPPPGQFPLSKRDKRRNALQDRVNELKEAFGNNRDYHFRQRVHELQNEMALISNAQVYEDWPISDSPEDVAKQLTQLAASGQITSDTPISGRWYSNFVQEINRSKEERDAELAVMMNRHRDSLNRIKQERDFRIQLAAEEYKRLTETIRERLVQSVSHRKNRLMREKEQLDVADTNALLLHPNQFSIANPGSPGGIQGNRKTRHTRHRLDADDIGGGIMSEPINKRKRKAIDEEFSASPNHDGLSTPADRAKSRMSQQQNAPAYNILSLFTEKELAMHSNAAHVAAVHFLSASKRAKQANQNANGQSVDKDEASGSGDASSQEDATPGAADMERSASQNVHATRSTRTNGTGALNLLGELTEKNSTRTNLPYYILGSYHQRPNGSSSAPTPPALMPEEIEDDLARIERLRNTKPPGWIDTRLVNSLLTTLMGSDDEQPPARNNNNPPKIGSLHPDFPPTMDVHLVRANPRKS